MLRALAHFTAGFRARAGHAAAVLATAALAIVALGGVVVDATEARPAATAASGWSKAERAMLRSLSLASLTALEPDPSNRYADDSAAVALGHELFFDTRLSANGKVSCATCHVASAEFQDSKPLAEGVGITARRTMPIAGTAHSPWLFWDGRSDSQWAQALGPLESAVEHGGNRTQFAHTIAAHYRSRYESVFGALPSLAGLPAHAGPVADSSASAAWRRIPAARREDITRVYANIGKAIAAYERRIAFAPSRFDRYVDAELGGRAHTPESALTPNEVAGLRLFIGKANCVNCHNGALLTDNHFHNTGVAASVTVPVPDSGRATGARQAVAGEFSCTSRYSDAKRDDCAELAFAVTEGHELVRAFKTPSLRNAANRPPYMHAGQLASLEDVVRHYSDAPRAPFGETELKRLRLSPAEQRQIVAFLSTLSGPLAAPAGLLEPPPQRR